MGETSIVRFCGNARDCTGTTPPATLRRMAMFRWKTTVEVQSRRHRRQGTRRRRSVFGNVKFY
ncbi:hypothetical protein PATSB16_25340 [Pandoraea thiooxydans]|nr:hypothetical protein PATSB16_25340 [Pandoraea thiooxydans]